MTTFDGESYAQADEDPACGDVQAPPNCGPAAKQPADPSREHPHAAIDKELWRAAVTKWGP